MRLHKDLKPGMKVKFIDNPSCSCLVCQTLAGRILTIDEIHGTEDIVVSVTFKEGSTRFPLDYIEEIYPQSQVPDELFEIE